jgi:O-antigen ligase
MKIESADQLFSVKLASYLTLATLVLLPLVYTPGLGSYTALRYFFFGTVCLILGLTTVWLWLKMPSIAKSFFKSWLNLGVLVYLLTMLIVSFTSTDVAASFFSSFQRTIGTFAYIFAAIFALNIYTLVTLKGREFIAKLLQASVIGAALLSILIMLFAFHAQGTWFETAVGGGTVGNSSLAATYVLWNIFFGFILILGSQTNKRKIIWTIPTFLMLASPLFLNWRFHYTAASSLTHLITARGAAIGLILGIVVAFLLWLCWQPASAKKNLGRFGLFIVGASLLFAGLQLLNPSGFLHQKFAAVAGDNRFIFWEIALKSFKIHPGLGWGPYTFNIPYQTFYDPKMAALPNPELWVDSAHNLIFDTLAGGGIVLLTGLAFFLYSIIAALFKARKNEQISPLVAGLFIGSVLAWLIQAQFVFESILSIAMLFLVAGIVSSLTTAETAKFDVRRLTGWKKTFYSALILAAVVLFVHSVGSPFRKARAMFAILPTHLPARTALWAQLSAGSEMGDNIDSILLFRDLRDQYRDEDERLRTADIKERQAAVDELNAAVTYLAGVAANKKYSYEFALLGAQLSYQRMVIANNFSGEELARGLKLADQAIELSPTDPESYWIAAKIQFGAQNYPETKKLFEQALALEPDVPASNQYILNFAKITKDDAYYQAALKRAQQNIPGFQAP